MQKSKSPLVIAYHFIRTNLTTKTQDSLILEIKSRKINFYSITLKMLKPSHLCIREFCKGVPGIAACLNPSSKPTIQFDLISPYLIEVYDLTQQLFVAILICSNEEESQSRIKCYPFWLGGHSIPEALNKLRRICMANWESKNQRMTKALQAKKHYTEFFSREAFQRLRQSLLCDVLVKKREAYDFNYGILEMVNKTELLARM